MKTRDLTPTWSELLPALLAIYSDGEPDGRAFAVEQLAQMARICDAAADSVAREYLADPAGIPSDPIVAAAPAMLDTLRLVRDDLNTTLDYETRVLVEHVIGLATGGEQ